MISIGAAFGLTLVDGRRVFLKAWSPAAPMALLRDAHTVQSFLAGRRGYPCPAVLSGASPFGAGHAALHEYRDEGEHADANAPSLRRAMAAALARLVALAAPLRHLAGLPRWVPRDGPLVGTPHNALFDFEATRPGAGWIERIAEASREVLLAADGPLVIAHRDWSARNMRFSAAARSASSMTGTASRSGPRPPSSARAPSPSR